jgi:hypothetical protein
MAQGLESNLRGEQLRVQVSTGYESIKETAQQRCWTQWFEGKRLENEFLRKICVFTEFLTNNQLRDANRVIEVVGIYDSVSVHDCHIPRQ